MGHEAPRHGGFETKFAFDDVRARDLRGWVEARCAPDGEFPHNEVVSIYYDTPDLRMLDEKVNSDFHKTKIRVRWYARGERITPGEARIEAKLKRGATRAKLRVPLGISGEAIEAASFEGLRIRRLPERLRREGIAVPWVVPVVQIRYDRRRYVDPVSRARISVDSAIRAERFHRGLFAPRRPARLAQAVLEIKHGRRTLPPWSGVLPSLGCRREAFSKYRVCCDALAEAA